MKIKPVLLYILFFMAAILFFIYILFPQKDAAGYISGLLDENNSKLQFSCERVKLKLPLKLSMENPKPFNDASGPVLDFAVKLQGHNI